MAQLSGVHLRMVVPEAPWTRGLTDGSVSITRLSWECVASGDLAPQRFAAAARDDFDVGEEGMRSLLIDALAGGEARALPVFFGREHMQRNIVVRADSNLTHPRDLVGKRVGSRQPPFSGTNAGVLLMLEQAYGVPLTEIAWTMREPEALPVNRMGLRITRGPATNAECFDLLLRGELDAVIVGGGPRYRSLFGPDGVDEAIQGYPSLRPLITDPATIADAYRRTGLYPITDLVVLSTRLIHQHPDLSARVLAALSAANRLAPRYRPAEEERLAQREVELLGKDPHQYGDGENLRRNLTALIDFFYRTGSIERPPSLDQLLLPSET